MYTLCNAQGNVLIDLVTLIFYVGQPFNRLASLFLKPELVFPKLLHLIKVYCHQKVYMNNAQDPM